MRHAGGPGRGGEFGGHRGGGRGGRGGGDMFRIGRMLAQGDLKLLALSLIAEQPRHGYEIIKVIEEKTAGWYSPSPGVVYPTLTFLEEAGYVTSEPDGAKKRYAITEEGRAYLAENRDFADAIIGRLSEIGLKMGRVRKWMGWSENGPSQGAELPRLVEAALENLRDVAQQKLEANRGAETRIVEILARVANDIREA
ncbi:PadR family transcriptional regulator [Xanthobacter oligotrophicus]|uniref:PadR family transcriptional regulator n=1 Tax=Xanthobacter oligotrophicus TaxID=2607286 RepID=UPI0011F3E45B|nr:PadR family transcriptional regulator [Xanthobacter oligotrophicus]MCG5235246.1 PadR family transcriptional regulator [Xanthobacter oligotrophicus]